MTAFAVLRDKTTGKFIGDVMYRTFKAPAIDNDWDASAYEADYRCP